MSFPGGKLAPAMLLRKKPQFVNIPSGAITITAYAPNFEVAAGGPACTPWRNFTLPIIYGQAGDGSIEPTFDGIANMFIAGGTTSPGNIILQGHTGPPPDWGINTDSDAAPNHWWCDSEGSPTGFPYTITCTGASTDVPVRTINDVFKFDGFSTNGIGASDTITSAVGTTRWLFFSGGDNRFSTFDGIGTWHVDADFDVTDGGGPVASFTVGYVIEIRPQP